MTSQVAELHAMVAQYSLELLHSWELGTPPAHVRRLKYSLGGARECLALVLKGPPRAKVITQ